MKILKNKLKNELNIRTQNDYPVKGVEFIDITPLLIDKELFHEIIDLLAADIKKKKIDYIVAPEARGFLLGAALAYNLNVGLIPVRKKGKLPPIAVEISFDYEKEYGTDTLELPRLVNEDYTGKNFYIVDDIFATGNTIRAIKAAIESCGGVVKGTGVIINIKELNTDNKIYSIIDINEGN